MVALSPLPDPPAQETFNASNGPLFDRRKVSPQLLELIQFNLEQSGTASGIINRFFGGMTGRRSPFARLSSEEELIKKQKWWADYQYFLQQLRGYRELFVATALNISVAAQAIHVAIHEYETIERLFPGTQHAMQARAARRDLEAFDKQVIHPAQKSLVSQRPPPTEEAMHDMNDAVEGKINKYQTFKKAFGKIAQNAGTVAAATASATYDCCSNTFDRVREHIANRKKPDPS